MLDVDAIEERWAWHAARDLRVYRLAIIELGYALDAWEGMTRSDRSLTAVEFDRGLNARLGLPSKDPIVAALDEQLLALAGSVQERLRVDVATELEAWKTDAPDDVRTLLAEVRRLRKTPPVDACLTCPLWGRVA